MRPRWKACADPRASRLVPYQAVMAVSGEQRAGIMPDLVHGELGRVWVARYLG